MMKYAAQKGYIVAAQYACDARRAGQLLRTIERLAARGVVAYSVRNRVRQELKSQAFVLPPRHARG